ncbi:hypothetical protein BGZ83_009176 [Gryganskiella cystojenkinii]|nr:hypothetical protein BGZ83_009176 [Gryganskiella cystojenkinii]
MSNQNKGKSQTAATHSGGMRAEAKKSRIVFKNVLDTPFNISWPEVTADDNAIVLDALCELLEPIRGYHYTHSNKNTSITGQSKKAKAMKPNTALAAPVAAAETSFSEETNSVAALPPPPILKSVCIGINSVTKALERSIQDIANHPSPSAVFLCKADLAPAHLYSHLGPMIAMLPKTLLCPLQRGSEQRLSKALGMKAVGAVAVLAGSKEAEDLVMMLERMVEPMSATWLPKVMAAPIKKKATGEGVKETKSMVTSADTASASTTGKSSAVWIPTNIKSVKTTMPIVIKTPKPPVTNTVSETNIGNNSNQKQPQSKSQSQSQNRSQGQKGEKGQKRAPEGPAGDRGKDKKAKS